MPHPLSYPRSKRARGIAAILSILLILPLPCAPNTAAMAEEIAECSVNNTVIPKSAEYETVESPPFAPTSVEASGDERAMSKIEEANRQADEEVNESTKEVSESLSQRVIESSGEATGTDDQITEQTNSRTAEVIIEEIAWAGSSISLADEWVELANLGDTTATISGWQIRGAGEGGKTIFLPPESIIGPMETYLIANYRETDAKSALAAPVSLATTTVSLSNAALGLELRNADGVVIDRAGDGTAPFAGSSGPDFATMLRASPTSTGDAKDGWKDAAKTTGFKSEIADMGTPGFYDLCGEEVTSRTCPEQSLEESQVTNEVPGNHETPEENASETEVTDQQPNEDVSESSEEGDESPSLAPTSAEASGDGQATDEDEETHNRTSEQAKLLVSLNEIVSNPENGSEWIELTLPETATATDRMFLLYDSQGKITTVATGTAITMPGFLVVTLASAKLNNSGDSVNLHEADGTLIEYASFGALAKGAAWARDLSDADNVWRTTTLPTPGTANVFPSLTSASTFASASTSASASTQSSTTETPSSTASETTTSTAAAASAAAAGARLPVSINEIVSNPDGGPEWIELVLPETATATDRALLLYDGTGKIATVAIGTPATAPGFLVVALASAKLNNAGDEVSLRETDGTLIAHIVFGKLAKGTSWAIDANGEWSATDTPTPGASNSQETTGVTNEEEGFTNEAEGTNQQTDEAANQKTTTKKAPTSTAKTAAAKKTVAITNLTFDMLTDTALNSVHARVSGTAGSVAGLLGASNAFILLAEDGRGLIVYLPKHLHVPPLGSSVRLTGTLKVTVKGPELRMGTKDIWTSLTTSTPPIPRPVDLLALGEEDAWSLTTIEGTVSAVNTASFTMETDDGTDVTIAVPAAAGFRVKRLTKSDRVRIIGFADPRKAAPTVIARSGLDISILEHAEGSVTPLSTAANATRRFPAWAPFGAAGGAIVATGAGKRLREILRKRKLKRVELDAQP